MCIAMCPKEHGNSGHYFPWERSEVNVATVE